MSRRLSVRPCKSFRGTIRPPSDKSLTHRAYMFAALARQGVSIVKHPLTGEDCESTLGCLEALGAEIQRVSETEVRIGAIKDWVGHPVTLDCGNSGTTMRLLCGILAGREGVEATLVGDASLAKRPMGRVVQPLRQMGAEIKGETAPVWIRGRRLEAIDYESPVASAQVKSAILLAGLRSSGQTTVTEPFPSRDHTERMLTALGVQIDCVGNSASVQGGQEWDAFEFDVPGDMSSAAFWMVAALAHEGSEVIFEGLGVNPSRTGILDLLGAMFGQESPIDISGETEELGEPVCRLKIQSPGRLPAFTIQGDLVPRLIDEIPVLAVLATQCHGTTVIRDAQELRVKETDRIAVVTQYLSAMGADIEAMPDGMVVRGPTRLKGATVDSAGDHRIGMAFAIAGSLAHGETVIENAHAIDTSYPGFARHFEQLSGIVLEGQG